MHDPRPGPARSDGPHETLLRATTFLAAYADAEISIADVAEASCVSVRAVQLAFRHLLDTTPTAYLREVRLARAHADLIAARPGDGVTVADVAAHWRFSCSGRFARLHRDVYGANPADALHAMSR